MSHYFYTGAIYSQNKAPQLIRFMQDFSIKENTEKGNLSLK